MKNAIINKWFREALEGSNVSSFVTDENLKYVAVINPMVLGNDERAFIGRTPREVFANIPTAEALCLSYEKVMETGETVKTEALIENVWFEVILRPTDLPNGNTGVLGISTDITRQKIMLREQAHRTKNAFTMAMAMASHTARGMDVPSEFKTKLHARLEALSRSQDAVSLNGGMGTTFQSLISQQIGHAIVAEPDRFILSVSDNCFISADLAQYITLAIYELYTNAVKYGSLSTENGTVKVDCSMDDRNLHIVWTERGGPAPSDHPPGFGRMLISSVIPKAARGHATFDLQPEGLTWTFEAPTSCALK